MIRFFLIAMTLVPLGVGQEAPFEDATFQSGFYDLNPAWSLSFSDIDHDGYPDLFVSNHIHYPSRLFMNLGDGFFKDVTIESGINEGMDDHDASFGDYDNDGDEDLITTNGYYQEDRFFRNEGNRVFTDVTQEASYTQGHRGRGRNCMFMDFDNDGFLDIFVCNCLSHCIMYWNKGDGTYVTDSTDMRLDTVFRQIAAGIGDLDGNGLMDIIIGGNAKFQPVQLHMNLGGRVFDERAEVLGIKTDHPTYGVVLGDYDNDQDLDIYLCSDSLSQPGCLFQNQGNKGFIDVTKYSGLTGATGKCPCGVFFDFDNDGDLDLYIVNSGRKNKANKKNYLYQNMGNGRFQALKGPTGMGAPTQGNGSSVVTADVDGDGDLDLAMANGEYAAYPLGPTMLYLNRSQGNHFLRLNLQGTSSNRNGYGAKVRLYLDDKVQYRQVGMQNSYSQNENTVHFGLGASLKANYVTIQWPSGRTQVLYDIPADMTLSVKEPKIDVWFGGLPELMVKRAGASSMARRCVEKNPEMSQAVKDRAQELITQWSPVLKRAFKKSELMLANPVSEETKKRFYHTNKKRYVIPPMVWVTQAALGRVSMEEGGKGGKEPTPKQLKMAKEIQGEMEKGVSVQDLSNKYDLQTWRSANPMDRKASALGYISQGFYSFKMLQERLDKKTAQMLWNGKPSQILGPVLLKEGMDVQDPSLTEDIVRIFRVGPKIKGRALPFQAVAPGIGRYLEKEKAKEFEKKTLEMEADTITLPADLALGLSIEAHAQALMEEELARHSKAHELFVKNHYEEHQASFQRQQALKAIHLNIRWAKEGEAVGRLLKNKTPFEQVLEKLKVPGITARGARSSKIFQHETTLTASRIRFLTDNDVFEEIWNSDKTLFGPYEDKTRSKNYFYITGKEETLEQPFDEVKKTLLNRFKLKICRDSLVRLLGQ